MKLLVLLTVSLMLAQSFSSAAPTVHVPQRPYICAALFQLFAHAFSDEERVKKSALAKYDMAVRDMPSYSPVTQSINQGDLDEIQRNITSLEDAAVKQREVIGILLKDCFVHYPPAIALDE